MNPPLEPNSLLRRWTGPLTSELALRSGDFGLGRVPARFKPDATTSMVCGFCSVGCGLNVHLQQGQAVNLTPNPDYPVNLGMACPKGWEALTPLAAPDRALTPLLRNDRGELAPVDWDTALQVFTVRLKAIQDQYGPESIAWLGTGQIPTEELALLGAVAKFGMGMVHGDSNTRQCMATSAVAYKQTFGFDAPPFTYADLEESDVIILIGANVAIAHPILWQRILRNRHQPQIIVLDPRTTETAVAATQHYALLPKSDLTLFYGLARLLIERNWIDREYIANHTEGFPEFAQLVAAFTAERVAEVTGLAVDQLEQLAETIHQGRAVSFWWTMGINQGHESTRTAQAIINLALITGNLGRPGTGANSITGQCNAMGSRLFSNTTSLLGGRDSTATEHRETVAQLLGLPVARIPASNSWSYDQILAAIAEGRIRGLWVIATNPAHSWINQDYAREVLGKLDFLVVQDMYSTTETARLAHLLLPSAGWGEKEGTFINSERRIGLLKKVSRAPGQALSDFNIFRLVAQYWGCGEWFARWTSPEAVFQILKDLSRGQPFDISGITDYRMLDACGGVQWPWPAAQAGEGTAPPRERRLFGDGHFFTPNGKARLLAEAPRPLPEPTDAEYPFILLTGRGTSAQWHTQTRTGKSAVLRTMYPENLYVEINPLDAGRLGLVSQDLVTIASRRGAIQAHAFVTATVAAGQVFLPMHYAATNRLTFPAFDPYSRQPAYKYCAVKVCRAAAA